MGNERFCHRASRVAAGHDWRTEVQRVSPCPQLAVYDALSHERGAHWLGRLDVFELDAPSAQAEEIHAQTLYLYVSSVVPRSDHGAVPWRHAGHRLPNPHSLRQILRRILGDGKSEEEVKIKKTGTDQLRNVPAGVIAGCGD